MPNADEQPKNPNPNDGIMWVPQENPIAPGAIQADNNFQVAVLAMQDYYRAENTKDAYENKGKEFIQYCQLVYDGGPTQFSL